MRLARLRSVPDLPMLDPDWGKPPEAALPPPGTTAWELEPTRKAYRRYVGRGLKRLALGIVFVLASGALIEASGGSESQSPVTTAAGFFGIAGVFVFVYGVAGLLNCVPLWFSLHRHEWRSFPCRAGEYRGFWTQVTPSGEPAILAGDRLLIPSGTRSRWAPLLECDGGEVWLAGGAASPPGGHHVVRVRRSFFGWRERWFRSRLGATESSSPRSRP